MSAIRVLGELAFEQIMTEQERLLFLKSGSDQALTLNPSPRWRGTFRAGAAVSSPLLHLGEGAGG